MRTLCTSGQLVCSVAVGATNCLNVAKPIYIEPTGDLIDVEQSRSGPRMAKAVSAGVIMPDETSSTIGLQRRFNYALQPMPKEEFIKMITTDLPEAPAYFSVEWMLGVTSVFGLARRPIRQGVDKWTR